MRIDNPSIQGQIAYTGITTNAPSGSSGTINLNNGNTQILDLSSANGDGNGMFTVTFTNPATAGNYLVEVVQNSSTAIQVVWNNTYFVGGTQIPISTVLGSTTMLAFYYDGTNIFGSGLINHADLNGLVISPITSLGADDHTQYLLLAGRGTAQTVTNNLYVTGQVVPNSDGYYSPAGTVQSIDFNLGNSAVLNLGAASGNVTLTLLNAQVGGSYIIEIIQAGSPLNVVWGTPAVKWPAGVAPTISTGAGAIDIISLYYNGTMFGTYAQAMS